MTNPVYAGVSDYGKSCFENTLDASGLRKKRVRKLPVSEWGARIAGCVGQAATVIAVPYLATTKSGHVGVYANLRQLWGPSIAQEMVKPATEQAFTKTVRYFSDATRS
jgi:hypothetical protein